VIAAATSRAAASTVRAVGVRRSVVVAVVAAAAVGGIIASGAIDSLAAPAGATVTIDGVAYQPPALTVQRGQTVTWVNKDPFPHTVTAAGTFDSHDIAAGKSWQFTPRKAGQFDYICTLHPNMKGTLKVE
jgi:plastocyanin